MTTVNPAVSPSPAFFSLLSAHIPLPAQIPEAVVPGHPPLPQPLHLLLLWGCVCSPEHAAHGVCVWAVAVTGTGYDPLALPTAPRSGQEGFAVIGTITQNTAKHTASGHALRKENSSDKTYCILCLTLLLLLPLGLKKTSNDFICSQCGKKSRRGR